MRLTRGGVFGRLGGEAWGKKENQAGAGQEFVGYALLGYGHVMRSCDKVM